MAIGGDRSVWGAGCSFFLNNQEWERGGCCLEMSVKTSEDFILLYTLQLCMFIRVGVYIFELFLVQSWHLSPVQIRDTFLVPPPKNAEFCQRCEQQAASWQGVGCTWYPCICAVPGGCEHPDHRLHEHLCRSLFTWIVPIDLNVNATFFFERGSTVSWTSPSVADAVEVVPVPNLLPAVRSHPSLSKVISSYSPLSATQLQFWVWVKQAGLV